MTARTDPILVLLLTAAALLSACSSGSDDDGVALDPPDTPRGTAPDTPPADGGAVTGIRPNTGLAGAPRGGVETTSPRPARIDLDYLTGPNGFSVDYPLEPDDVPRTFDGLGDVNGDGLDDFAFSTATRTHVVYGDGSRLPPDLDIGALSGARGFVLDQGLRLDGVGDVDGDGIGDVAWPTYDAGTDSTGARVVFGRSDGALSALPNLPPDGRQGFALVNSVRRFDIRSVQAAGDIDGDGLDDVLVGAFAFNSEDYDAPNAWIVYGRDDGFPAVVDVARLEPSRGLALTSPLSEEQRAAVYDDIGTGYDARAVGGFDFDGDGLDDVAIGASTFDWIERTGSLRTYVVFGDASRTRTNVDMRALDGGDGVVIVEPAGPFGADVDGVASLGDVDGDGTDDLAVFDAVIGGDAVHVVYGRANGFGPVIDRTSLPAGAGLAIVDFSGARTVRSLARTGDVDGDGLDDIGIEYVDGAAILYGGVDTATTVVDLASPGTAAASVVDGGGDGELVALGDVDGDGVDDLGVGWSVRPYDAGIREIDDLNGDGVDDLVIGPSETASLNLLRVLYGFGGGFTGVLPDTDAPKPLERIDADYHDTLLSAMELAARAPLEHVNTALASGTPLEPVVAACLLGSDGVDTASVTRFECDAEPLPFAFDWGGRRFSGTAGGRYAAVGLDDEGLRTIRYEGFPPVALPFGGSPYHARFTFERGERVTLFGTEPPTPEAPPVGRCAIETETLLATGDAAVCTSLIAHHVRVLNALFGPEREVGELRFGSDS